MSNSVKVKKAGNCLAKQIKSDKKATESLRSVLEEQETAYLVAQLHSIHFRLGEKEKYVLCPIILYADGSGRFVSMAHSQVQNEIASWNNLRDGCNQLKKLLAKQ